MSCHYPFCRVASLVLPAVAAFVLLTSAQIWPARAQAVQPAQQATLSDTRQIRCCEAARAARGRRQCRRRRPGQSAAEEPPFQGDREGQGSREIGRRHFQPRALSAAEGRRQEDGIAAACGEQARRRRAGGDRRVRFVVDTRPWRDIAGLHLSQPAGGAAAPAISDRQHHRGQRGQGRRGRARNDEAAADRRARHAVRIW